MTATDQPAVDMTELGRGHGAARRLGDREGPRHFGPAKSPPPVDHEVAPAPKGQQHDTVKALIEATGKAQQHLRHHGDLLFARTADWEKNRRIAPPSLADEEDEEHRSDTEAEERQGDALASRFGAEVRQIAHRVRADLARLAQIDAIVHRAQPRELRGREMVELQVAADGWCTSCWRNDQRLVEVQKQPSGVPFYKGLCRFCGLWKAEHNQQLPSLDVLQRHHDGRRIHDRAS